MLDQDKAAASRDIPLSRSLVVLGPREPSRAEDRPASGFLAQLIACQRRLPAYRGARMAEPGRAASAYGGHSGLRPAQLDCSV